MPKFIAWIKREVGAVILLGVVALLLLVALPIAVANGLRPDTTATTDSSPASQATEQDSALPKPTIDDVFVTTVTDSQPDLSAAPPSSLIEVAQQFCGLLDDGHSVVDAATVAIQFGKAYGVTAEQVGAIIGAGIPAYCPQHSTEFHKFVTIYGGN